MTTRKLFLFMTTVAAVALLPLLAQAEDALPIEPKPEIGDPAPQSRFGMPFAKPAQAAQPAAQEYAPAAPQQQPYVSAQPVQPVQAAPTVPQTAAPLLAPPAAANLAPVAVTPPPAKMRLPLPAMSGPLGLNTSPKYLEAKYIGKVYVGGVLSGAGLAQTHATGSNKSGTGDLTNAQVYIENTDSPVQFYVQAGAYAIPALGRPYVKFDKTTRHTYGYVPEAFVRTGPFFGLALSAGKMESLLSTERPFSFQNMNVSRGLLAQQQSSISRGVQADYAAGPWAASVSFSDGFYSDHYNWVSGKVSYALDDVSSVSVAAGGNIDQESRTGLATPLAQNNSNIYNISYVTKSGPWTINPVLQYTRVGRDTGLGLPNTASSYGAALNASYALDEHLSLAGRAEYMRTKGSSAPGATDLLYGGGSRAWSVSLTPTYQYDILFARLEGSYIRTARITPGLGFGPGGLDKDQARLLLEAGILF